MKFGIFDYIDQRDQAVPKIYDERMELIQAAEAAGFHSYHLTEHHWTPLQTAPSPSIFLAALARETTHIRFGALVYLLPIHHPLRLLEELCMLDNLSNGRLDIGVGRGISPYEFSRFGEDIKDSEAVFNECLDILHQGLTQDRLDHRGRRYQIENVPILLRAVQRPYPPFWYGLRGNEEGCILPARRGMNAVTLGSDDRVAQTLGYFRAAWQTYAEERQRFGSPVIEPFVGVVRTMFIADNEQEAEQIGRQAYKAWYHNLNWLWRQHGDNVKVPLSPDFDTARLAGTLIVGSPEQVRGTLVAQVRRFRHNYLVLQLAFGSLTHAQEMRSLELFRTEVMPALNGIPLS